jgi:hypothetical protein
MKSERRCIKLPTIKTIVLVMMLGVLLMQLVGCGGTSSSPNILGKWTASSQDMSANPGYEGTASVEFFEDGTCVIVGPTANGSLASASLQYSLIDYTHIKFQNANGSTYTSIFSLSGDTLTITNDTGTLTLHRTEPGGSSPSPSSLYSEAQSAAIDEWAALLNARQSSTNSHLYTTVSNMSPAAVSQALSKGNSVLVAWEECNNDSRLGTKGEVEIKNFRSSVAPLVSLSEADKANGITWKGDAKFSFLMRYRGVAWRGSTSFRCDEISPPPASEPFSPWMDEQIGSFCMEIHLVKQNGKWTTEVVNEAACYGGDWYHGESIINPFPLNIGINGNSELGKQPYMIKQTEPYQFGTPATTSGIANTVTNMMASADNLRILGSFDSVTNAYDTSSSSYWKLYWTYGQQLKIPNSGTNLYAKGKYTQTKDGAGNYPGECVSLVKALTNTGDLNTESWGKGKYVMMGGVMPGTAIATFTKNKYTQYNSGIDHAAIFKGLLADGSGFEVWDQNWDFTGVVGTHAITRSSGLVDSWNTWANNYSVIEIPSKD